MGRGLWEFPGGLVVRIVGFQLLWPGYNPCPGNRDPASCVAWPKKFFKGSVGESCKGACKTQRADGRENKAQKAEGNPFQSLPSLMPLINRQLNKRRAPGEETETASEEMEASRTDDQTGILEQMNKMWKSKGEKTPLQAEILTRRK